MDAAASLFLEQGYAATTLAQVAERAGVAVQTLYFHVGNKRTLLKEVVDLAAAGDDEPVPVLERPWVEEMRQESDPRRVIALWVDYGRDLFVRVAPVMGMVRDAATSEPEAAAQLAENEAQRLVAFALLPTLLADRGALREGLGIEEATDLVFALNSIEVYLLLTQVRGWTPQRWGAWLVPTLEASLLAPESHRSMH